MVARVPAQSQKLVPQLPSDRAATLTAESIPPGFHASHLHGSRFTYSCRPFVFIFLQIPSPAPPLFSHPYKTPGVSPLCDLCAPISVPSVLRFFPPLATSPLFYSACRLFFSLFLLLQRRSLCFQSLAASFAKTPGVGVGRHSSALPTAHFLSIQQPAWWKQVRGYQCD